MRKSISALYGLFIPALLSVALAMSPLPVVGQQGGKKLLGIVSDDNGPIAGASVSIKGTVKGTITNAKGEFILEEVRPGHIVVVSFLGYKTQEVAYGGQWRLAVHLKEDAQRLDEIVVTALGIPKESKSLGYAISTVNSKDLLKAGSPNFASALYGKAPGVRIQSSTGGNASAVSVTVRGLSSLTGNTQPLLIVDGVPVRNGNANNDDSWDGDRIYSNGIVDINPDDIENLSILKGAAASALYGSEAANGVILVSTKKGRSGGQGVGVEFNATLQGNFVAYMPKVQNEFGPGRPVLQRDNDAQRALGGLDYMDYKGKTYQYPVLRSSFSFGPKYDGRQVLYWDGTVRNYRSVTDSPLSDLFRTGFNQSYHIALSKGGEKSSGRFSYTYVNEIPNQYNSTYAKHNFNASGILHLHDKLHLSYNASYIRQAIKNRPREIAGMIDNLSSQFHSFDDVNLIRRMIVTGLGYRNVNAGEATLSPNEAFVYDNPTGAKGYYWDILGKEQFENNSRLIAAVTPTWTIVEGLNLRGHLSTDLTAEDIERYSYTEKPLVLTDGEQDKTGAYLARNNKYDIYYGDVMLMFDKDLSSIVRLTANAGFQGRSEWVFDTWGETRNGLSVENWFHLNASADTPKTDQNKRELLKAAWFGAAGISFVRALYLEGTIRREQSSTLAPKRNTFVYPSANMSFVFSELLGESSSWDYGKLRVSYGVVGNAPDIYLANIAYRQKSLNNIPYNTIDEEIGNDHIRPETKYEWEFGFENRFWDNRLGFELSYYTNRVEDQILPVPTSLSVGGTSILQNVGTIANYGFEFAFSIRPIETRRFSWDMRFNYAFNRNKVKALADNTDVLEHTNNNSNVANSVFVWSRVGEQMGDIMTYAPKEDDRGRPLVGPDGLYVVEYGKENLKKAGNAIPYGTGGIGTTLSLGNVHLDASIDFRLGGAVVSDGYQYTMARGINPASLDFRDTEHGGISYYFPNNDVTAQPVKTDSWASVGPNYERIYHNGVILDGVKADAQGNIIMDGKKAVKNDVIVPSDKYYNYTYNVGASDGVHFANSVFDNSYMKLRELSIAWTLPQKFTESIGCSSLNLALFGRNLCYFFKNESGYDPESTAGTAWWNQVFIGTATSASTRSVGVSLRAAF
ncbi:MAG: SusC/RagA family TonB-linked outer membrane protein [Tannerellaceae bacterium]|jgi:TonB-linked SusC/RagA family outer membrane protein|nr:SusC/RagA family TonB-linked outer membrane protein [Tannerellaceae bacterium]